MIREKRRNIMDQLKQLIREVPDFPKPGINFYDITTLLKHPEGLRLTVDALAAEFEGENIDTVVGVEARGFIFAPALAYHLRAGFVPVRKPKKLPAEKASARDSSRRNRRRSSGRDRGRFAGHGRHGASCGRSGRGPGWKNCRPGLCR